MGVWVRWNGTPDFWDGGRPGDGNIYRKTVYISSVRVTPFNEPNDVMYPDPFDQPDGCETYFTERTAGAISNLRREGCGVEQFALRLVLC